VLSDRVEPRHVLRLPACITSKMHPTSIYRSGNSGCLVDVAGHCRTFLSRPMRLTFPACISSKCTPLRYIEAVIPVASWMLQGPFGRGRAAMAHLWEGRTIEPIADRYHGPSTGAVHPTPRHHKAWRNSPERLPKER
jgi:hypothetical protein